MNAQEIEFSKLGGAKITLGFGRFADGEVTIQETNEEAEKLRSEAAVTGEWWHLWEQDHQLITMAEAYGYSPDESHAALCTLKRLFPATWLQDNINTCHRLVPSLVEPKNFFHQSGLKAIHLGYAINQLGWPKKVKSRLRNSQLFESTAFELEVLAWLKPNFPNLRLEHELKGELGLTPDLPKPDAMLNAGLYAEVRNLQTSKVGKTLEESLNGLGHRLAGLVDRGAWEWHIDLGVPKNQNELETAYKDALAILNRARPPFEDTEGRVHIQMVQVAEDVPEGKAIVGSSTNFPPLELLELDRMVRHLVHKRGGIARKLGALQKGSCLIVYFRPTVPTVNLMLLASGARGEETRNKLSEELFKFAIEKDDRVKAIRQVYIEVWRAIAEAETELRRSYKTNPFLFFGLDNPFFSPCRT